MTKYEEQYYAIGKRIFEKGHIDGECRTGNRTKRVPNVVIHVDALDTPVLQSKKFFWESAIEEILWIMQTRSNNVNDLRPKIWNKWADADGSIGKSYGYQVAKKVTTKQGGVVFTYDNQVKYVLDTLEKDPNDRRCIITLWDIAELAEMNLNPCCHTSTWNLDGGVLNALLDQRSGDFPAGVPFNTFQYKALLMMFAKCLGVPKGDFLHVIADCHIYDNQMDLFEGQLENMEMISQLRSEVYKHKPVLVLNYVKDDTLSAYENFMKIKLSDFELLDYEHMGAIPYPVN